MLQCWSRNYENVILVAHRRKHFWIFKCHFFCFWISKTSVILVLKNSLTTCQLVSSWLRATRSDVSFPRQISVLGHCWVDSPHINTTERGTLIFHGCLLCTVTVLPNFEGECQIWDYVNRDTSFNLWQFWLESRRRAAYCGGELRNRESWLHGNGKEAGLKCTFSLSRTSEPLAQDRYYARSLVLFVFFTGNSSLESLPEGVLAQIHMNLSSRGFGWIEVGTCGQPIFLLGAMLLSIGLKWRMNHTP